MPGVVNSVYPRTEDQERGSPQICDTFWDEWDMFHKLHGSFFSEDPKWNMVGSFKKKILSGTW